MANYVGKTVTSLLTMMAFAANGDPTVVGPLNIGGYKGAS